ncbi:hypothetical protein C8J57DRAFT_1563876 [Mycena rebaudengoi]|nr:hypothetical protein C8J57DRAFT_1563876 [Mycena rebaudengoi]
MLFTASIFLSVLLAGASPARRAPCSPQGIAGTNISITNGAFEAGFSSNGSTLVSQRTSTAISEFTVATSNSTNEFKLLKVTNKGLALTNTGALPEMLPVEPPSSIRQNWAFECSSCVREGSPGITLIGEGCLVVSQFDGRCLNINDGAPVGSSVTLGNCQAIGSSINIYTAYLMMAQIQLLIVNYSRCYLLLKTTVENSTSRKFIAQRRHISCVPPALALSLKKIFDATTNARPCSIQRPQVRLRLGLSRVIHRPSVLLLPSHLFFSKLKVTVTDKSNIQ